MNDEISKDELAEAQKAWAAEVKKMQDATAKEFQPEPEPESPHVKELQSEARRLAQDGKNGESLRVWVRVWEAKAAAWEAAGKPEYAAAERAQAEQCRRQLASIDEPPTPPAGQGYGGQMQTLGDLIVKLKHPHACHPTPTLAQYERAGKQGEEWAWDKVAGVADLRAICQERGMVGLSLKALSHVWAEYLRAADKTVQQAWATPLVDVVAILREASAPVPSERVTLDDIVAVVKKPKRQTIKNHMTAARKVGRLVPDALKTGGTSEDTYPYPQLRAWLIVEFPRYDLDSHLPRDAAGLAAAKMSARKASRT